MDVRCDRCQTEYELDDASVAEGGASVQCTTCGHTFMVSRDRPGPTPVPVVGSGTNTPSWMLTTEEGRTHRFRDSTTLQKWVVERRVTRADRVCPPGGTWRRLGEIDELRPFFDVVAQADRAAAAARGARQTRPETPRASAQPSRPSYVSPDLDDDDILTGGQRRQAPSASHISLSNDDLAAAGLGNRRRGRVLIGIAVLGLAAVAGYLGFKGTGGLHLPGTAPAAAPPAPTAAAPASPAPAATPAPPPPAPAATAPAAPVAVPAAPAPAPAPAVAPHPAAAESPPPAAPAPAAAAPAAAAHDDAGRPKNYERLVVEGDRAIENGQTAKAQKLYDEALKMQPNGAAAVTGSAYVLLDRQKPLAAIDTFKRALANSPGYPQALFGLGEAYRLEGEPAQAVAAYKRYLESSPTGTDAPAARRQIAELESHVAPRAPQPPPAPVEPPPP